MIPLSLSVTRKLKLKVGSSGPGIALTPNDKSLWDKLSSNAINYAKDQYSFESGKNQMKKILESVDLYWFMIKQNEHS